MALMEEWLDTCDKKVRARRLEELIKELRGEQDQDPNGRRVANPAPAGPKRFFHFQVKPGSIKGLSDSVKTFAKSAQDGLGPAAKRIVTSLAAPKQPVIRLPKPLAVVP